MNDDGHFARAVQWHLGCLLQNIMLTWVGKAEFITFSSYFLSYTFFSFSFASMCVQVSSETHI